MKNANSLGSVATGLALVLLCAAVGPTADARPTPQEGAGPKYIEAVAQGTSTQLGSVVSIKITIREYSSAEDQLALMGAFKAGGQKGLFNALEKMSAKGRISVTGTLGYDINYIRMFTTPAGRRIRLVTDRPITLGEAWHSTRSRDYNLSAAEIELGDGDDGTGSLLPACQFELDSENNLKIEAFRNPWKLMHVRARD